MDIKNGIYTKESNQKNGIDYSSKSVIDKELRDTSFFYIYYKIRIKNNNNNNIV